jgi:hypothetical protein
MIVCCPVDQESRDRAGLGQKGNATGIAAIWALSFASGSINPTVFGPTMRSRNGLAASSIICCKPFSRVRPAAAARVPFPPAREASCDDVVNHHAPDRTGTHGRADDGYGILDERHILGFGWSSCFL